MRRERDKKLIREEWDKMPNEEKKNIGREELLPDATDGKGSRTTLETELKE